MVSNDTKIVLKPANAATANGLEALTSEKLANAMQSTPENPLVGVEGRADLLRSLGRSLKQTPDIFGAAQARPGNMVGRQHLHQTY